MILVRPSTCNALVSDMDPITIVAAGGLRARMESLDLLANNIANTATAGYKSDREYFTTYLASESAASTLSNGRPQGFSPVLERLWTDLRQGTLSRTNNPNDLALSGSGFFVVETPQGPLYTRNGSFQVTAEGKLQTREGYEFVTNEPSRIRARRDLPVSVDAQGVVYQDGQQLGSLKIVSPAKPGDLEKRGETYFSIAAGAGLAASSAQVHQGHSEASNFSAAEASVRLVSVLRQFESLQKAMQIGAEMNRRASEDVARVSS